MVDGSGLENRHTRKGIGGSNPSLSAITFVILPLRVDDAVLNWITHWIVITAGDLLCAQARQTAGQNAEGRVGSKCSNQSATNRVPGKRR